MDMGDRVPQCASRLTKQEEPSLNNDTGNQNYSTIPNIKEVEVSDTRHKYGSKVEAFSKLCTMSIGKPMN